MDGENNGNPIKMDDLGVPLFSETPILDSTVRKGISGPRDTVGIRRLVAFLLAGALHCIDQDGIRKKLKYRSNSGTDSVCGIEIIEIINKNMTGWFDSTLKTQGEMEWISPYLAKITQDWHDSSMACLFSTPPCKTNTLFNIDSLMGVIFWLIGSLGEVKLEFGSSPCSALFPAGHLSPSSAMKPVPVAFQLFQKQPGCGGTTSADL